MKRALAVWTLGMIFIGCSGSGTNRAEPAGTGGNGGMVGTGGTVGTGGSGTGGAVSGTGGAPAGTGGSPGGTGGASTGGAPGGMDANSGPDAAGAKDAPAAGDAVVGGNGPGPGVVPLPGKTGDFICPHDATKAQCCQMLCECVNRICIDSPKAKPGLAGCLPTCMGLSEMVGRCHVYHCYESVSPSGVKDHDSHCGHAANQVNGGGCPAGVLP